MGSTLQVVPFSKALIDDEKRGAQPAKALKALVGIAEGSAGLIRDGKWKAVLQQLQDWVVKVTADLTKGILMEDSH